ncbi:hypothetical protein RFI_08629, partial [Reticulomyxa filosa]
IAYTGFVLVAGGLGERLGYDGVKPELPSEITTETSFMELYVSTLLAFQARAQRSHPDRQIKVPLAIMVSDDTHHKMQELMKRNNNFGMDNAQIVWMKQTKNAGLKNNRADFAMEGKYSLSSKPGGHGVVHSLMHSTGTARIWTDMGIRWVVFLQDTNGVAVRSVVSAIGVSAIKNYIMNSITIPRKPKQSLGAITKLTNATTGDTLTINVEYNQLESLLQYCGGSGSIPQSDVADGQTGYSKFPGNCNTLILQMQTYLAVLSRTKGCVAEFVNPKYADQTKTTFKSPAD